MNETITWSGQEHQHIERGSDWYWALGIIIMSSALTAVLLNNVLFALLIVLGGVTLGMLAKRPPAVVEFALGERGLAVGDTFYPYEEMRAFWVSEDDEPTLLIDTPRIMNPDLIIPLTDVDPNMVRAFLAERVPEIELHQSFIYTLAEFFGF
ncbi:MAG: hypothetical protein HYT30_01480 [Parcubacteria group bacterium]|nr:hypothetical protein [Parcubacteria group bacterium]